MDQKQTKYKILKGIEVHAANNRALCRALETYFKLKTLNNSSQYNVHLLPQYAKATGLSPRSIYNRLELIRKFNLGRKVGRYWSLISYSKLAEQYAIQETAFWFTRFHDLQSFIKVKAIEDAHNRQRKAFLSKVNRNTGVKETLTALTGHDTLSGQFAAAVYQSQVKDHNTAQSDNYELNLFRADFNVGYKYLSNLFNYNSRGGAAHLKRKLQSLGLIKVTSRLITINPKRYESLLGQVNYFRPDKLRVLQMPDMIEFLPPPNRNFAKN